MAPDLPSTAPSNPAPLRGRSLGEAAAKLRRNWLWIVLFGAALTLSGLLALGAVELATIATVLMVGVMMLVAGTAELAMGFRARDWSHFFLWVAGGIIYLAAGLFAAINPLLASVVLTLMLGAGLIAAGAVRIVHALQLPASNHRLPVIGSGLISLFLGMIIVAHWPINSIAVLGILLAVDLIFHGVGWIAVGFWLRNQQG